MELALILGMKEDGTHAWKLRRFNRPAVCNVCQQWLVALRGKQGLSCTCTFKCGIVMIKSFCPTVCKYTVHERCVARAAQNCIETYSKSGHAMPCARMKHHWVGTALFTVKGTVNFQVAGNCLGKCDRCRHSVKMHNGMHCRWCQTTVSLFED